MKHGEWVFQTFSNNAFPYDSYNCNIPEKDLNYFRPNDKDKHRILLENGWDITYGDNYLKDGDDCLMNALDLESAFTRLKNDKMRSSEKYIIF